MKKIALYISLILTGILVGIFFNPFASSSTNQHFKHQHNEEKTIDVWTCAMHPQIRKNEPGLCPICAMDLTVLDKDELEESKPHAIKMSATAMQLASVSTALVSEKELEKNIRVNGQIQIDKRLTSAITAEFSGRIDQLELTYEGEYVSKGQIIARLYSPELLVAQKELLEAKKMATENPQLFELAQEKLKNWNLSENQIQHILSENKEIQSFPIRATVDGIIQSKKVNSGQHIRQGQVLFEVSNLKSVWALFDVYEKDIDWIKKGQNIRYKATSFPGKSFEGKIDFIDPVLNNKSRIIQVRIVINNNKGQFKPGMFLEGEIKPKTNSGMGISIPKSAVMWTGKRSIVYVKSTSDNGVYFNLRKVKLGEEIGDNYQVKSGLKIGDEIAINGTFSIDAAAQLAGKPSMMNMDMGKSVQDLEMENLKEELTLLSTNKNWITTWEITLNDYFKLKDALTLDDLESAKTFGLNMNKSLEKFESDINSPLLTNLLKTLSKDVHSFNNKMDITLARNQFQNIANAIINVTKHQQVNHETYYIHTCPMAVNNKTGDWLSKEKKVINPYMGSAMLRCGSLKEELK